MRIKLHHVNLCTRDVAAMDAFYRDVLDLRPEPSLNDNRVTGEGYAGRVAFVSDGDVQVHLAEQDLGAMFRTGQAINPPRVDHGREPPAVILRSGVLRYRYSAPGAASTNAARPRP